MPQDLEHYKCWAELQDPPVPIEAVEKWFKTPDRQYHCIFCGHHYTYDTFPSSFSLGPRIQYCLPCKSYKGIEPCIPGYCPFGEQ